MALKKQQKAIQTGRALPRRYSSYSPVTKAVLPLGQPEPAVTRTPPRAWKRAMAIILILFFVFIIVVGTWDVRNITSAEQKMFDTSNIINLVDSSSLKGSDSGRVNMLLIGYSVDDPGHPAASLTDSIILLSMNTSDHSGYMLSIPRDLYVKIPGFGHRKINEAYQDGGVSLLEQIISQDFGVPVDYYALINYASVRDTVTALGGLTINIQSPDPRGLYDPNINPHDGGPLKLSNGVQTINGQTALNLTRARGDAYGSYGFPQADFDRTQHQRQVLSAIKSRLNWKLILNPRKNSLILDAVASNVKTDIASTEIRSLFGLFNSIPNANLESLSLRNLKGKNYLSSYTTSSGQSALIPAAGVDDYSEITAAIQQINQ